MSRITHGVARAGGFLPRSVAIWSLVFVVLFAQSGQAQQDSLSLFKNYFITGDYVVRGTSLWRKGVNGKAVVDLPKLGGADGVTPGADILAAFLYIQTAEKIQGSGIDRAKFGATPKLGKTFLGNDFGPFFAAGSNVPGSGTLAKALNWDAATLPCWSIAFPGGRRLVTYRADVLRFLPIDPATGKQALNTTFRLQVPDSGTDYADDDESGRERDDKSGPRAVGASLVVVYRDPAKPFKGVVIYDGGLTKRAFATMNQTIEGFYDASSGVPVAKSAKMTHIVGDGRPLLSERVKINDQVFTKPFKSVDGPKWDNWTVDIALQAHASSATVRVEPLTILPDCVSWSAIVLSTNVQDTDTDGLLDAWESNPPPNDVADPTHLQTLPNLAAMGANPLVKDLFVEIDYMQTTAPDGTLYGAELKPIHSHLPSKAALNLVGKAFADAPVPINVHFDVGNNYQDSPYVIPWDPTPAIPGKGGEAIDEMVTVCTRKLTDAPSVCQFSAYPGTVGWKTGLRFLKEELFARNRKDMFRYVFFTHAVGIPKDPCLNPNGTANLTCNTADFHVPVTNSGVADFPGGDLLVTLGAFDDESKRPIGTDFMQASTMMHEWGHTFELTHAGVPLVPREPNCKPQYLSVMNYMYQLHGLRDALGKAHLGYATQASDLINEISLTDGGLGALPYRIGWYAPKDSSFLKDVGKAATRHCDGSELSQAELDDLTGPTPEHPERRGGMVRVNDTSVNGIDWNANGAINSAFAQDINFSGATTSLNGSTSDWDNVFLNQLGGRRSSGGFYIDTSNRKAVGPLSLDIGRGDIGRGDIGRGDIGRGDIGRGDIGRGDIGRGDIDRGDIGRGDIGRGDIGRGDFGGGDLDVGAPNEPFTELDLETAQALGNAPPSGLKVCQVNSGEGCSSDGYSGLRYRLTWEAPIVGAVDHYEIYRVVGDTVTDDPEQQKVKVGEVSGSFEGLPFFVDDPAELATTYTYFVIAVFDDATEDNAATRAASNFATITTPETLPPAPWEMTTSANCDPTSTVPEIGFDGNAVTMGVARGDTSQSKCIHGVSALLPPLNPGKTGYRVTFTHDLSTWDSYNAVSGVGTGYFDSFSVSVSTVPYKDLVFSDPLTATGNVTGIGFLWGGTNFADGILECNPANCLLAEEKTVDITGNADGVNYLNVVLDTITNPAADLQHPSFGLIRILNIVQVP
jgi:hypothetical protein